ncbi:TPA: hypothetical protein ACH3X1_012396 [Trebouxia sp. C0004]
MLAIRFAEFLQTQAGKQQTAAGAGSVISLPLGISLMGLSSKMSVIMSEVTDGNTVYIVDGGLPRIPASSCWCYAFSSPQKSVYRYERKAPSCHLMFLPLWALEELQQCWGSVDIFSSTVTAELAELAFEFAGGVPRTVLQLPAQTANSSIPIRSFVVDILENAINRLPSEALQDTVNQILTVG